MKNPTAKMTTRQLKKKLNIAELPTPGSRTELEKRLREFRQKTLAEAGMSSSDEDNGEEYADASAHPAIVMIDEQTGNRYMRLVSCKGLGEDGEAKWVIKDLHEELKAWGRPGGDGNALIVKTDGKRANVALPEALAKEHGGLTTPEQPPNAEHAANGRVEQAGRTIRDMVRVLKFQLEANIETEANPS